MKLNVKKIIEDNIITVDISVAELGTSTTVQSEELNLLHDFTRSILYSNIDFKSNMKLDSEENPIVTTDQTDGSTIAEVKIENIINKEIPIDENMHIVFSLDVEKIPASELVAPFDTVEKMGKAKASLFATKIQEEISKKLTELRSLNTKFEGETEVVL